MTLFSCAAAPRLRTSLLALGLAASTGPALAQGPGALDLSMAKLAGSMTAAAVLCGDLGGQKLQETRAQQRALALERGMTAAAFDKGFDEGKRTTETRFAAMSPAGKKKSCTELRQWGDQAGKPVQAPR